MAIATKEVKICDICEHDTGGFRYWENTTNPFGVVSENSLVIDVCEHCAREIQGTIPQNMMEERYGSIIASESEILDNINKWKSIILD